jgi:hypothetical protein
MHVVQTPDKISRARAARTEAAEKFPRAYATRASAPRECQDFSDERATRARGGAEKNRAGGRRCARAAARAGNACAI